MSKPDKILALNPGTKETGFALFEDGELIDWGVWTFKPKKRRDSVKRALLKIIKRNKPNALVIEKPHLIHQKGSSKFNAVFGGLKRTAEEHKLTMHELDPQEVRETICQEGRATRVKIAKRITKRYLFLKRYLPQNKPVFDFRVLKQYLPRDKPILYLSHKEKYWLRMFDAIALGIAFIKMSPLVKS
ncbi:hypothetical protein KAW65_00235 [candidate division WOR-3 bacterium]|nr:hypothetical protein [candidate division WOR-3 bacterium]